MKINCRHGFFTFEETRAGDISRFMSISGFSIVADRDYFTFEKLADAPEYSIAGNYYLGAPVTETYADVPAEVMRANGLVYNLTTKTLVRAIAVTQRVELTQAGKYYISQGLIQPGSVSDGGKRISTYRAFYVFDTGQFKYSEVTFD